MNKIIFFKYYFLLILLIANSKEDEEVNKSEEDINNSYGDEFYGYFKESLKEYLIKNYLFNSDQKIEPDKMKKIFYDVVTEGSPENTPTPLKKSFELLSDYFIKKYYNDKKEIKGKEIYNLLDINEIYTKFEEIYREDQLNEYYNEEEEINLNGEKSVDNDL